jgi:hypothetical protein
MSTETANVIVTVEASPCPICLESYTTTLRKEVSCNYCHESACIKCIEKYLLNSIEDPHCLHCRRGWPRSTLSTFCTSKFLNAVYHKYRQSILLNREKSYLPQLQELAKRERDARVLEREDAVLVARISKAAAEYQREIRQIQQQRNTLYTRIQQVRTGAVAGTGEETAQERAKFIRRCTAEGCKGFLSSAWKCGMCSHWACPDCFDIKGPNKDSEHTCNPATLETAKLLRKDTKPCPSCGEMIMKSEGCDQMFCTSCHTPFSWVTGKIVTSGPIHNPHYFQWLNKGGGQPRTAGDIPCGGLPDAYNIRRTFSRNHLSSDLIGQFMIVYQMCAHIIDYERTALDRHIRPDNNNDIGIRYMMDELSEEMWMKLLAKREKDREKAREIRDVYDAFMGAVIDILRRIRIHGDGPRYTTEELTEEVLAILAELNVLREFTNEALLGISKSYNCSVKHIQVDWVLTSGKHTKFGRKRARRVKEEDNDTGDDNDSDLDE